MTLYHVDIFTMGSDWEGKFDFLSDLCTVTYLSRTEGISSTMIRNNMEPATDPTADAGQTAAPSSAS